MLMINLMGAWDLGCISEGWCDGGPRMIVVWWIHILGGRIVSRVRLRRIVWWIRRIGHVRMRRIVAIV